ncbi:mucin-5AC [Oncorhynchus mykiss]|uniref:RRM domain-containing protein n=1 Tax=Oncorhynchus mykiss TaxID=8022 RepID=A0A8L0DR62_ONCMY|nr:mucin-5AC [Oncorhynchus mykiss]XP_036807551.1 mucin-5AC [Oncorhynchus mykiss]XP_036807552.1 mucin-5AC [Oncorhynchus mykiss]
MNLSEENRTVVVSGVPDTLSSSRMADKLVIHFQSSRSHGGDVENIKYPTSFKGVAFVTFENTRDAEMVIRKKQIMCDKEFPQDYPITVFKFTQDVLFYVNAKVDLSIFGDEEQQETVIQSLQSAHRSVRICLLPSQEGKASVEGPFSAIRDLREDLLQQATASSSGHPGEKHGAPWSSGYSLTSVAAGNGVSQVSISHPGEKHRAPSSSGYSLTSVAAGNGVSQVSSSHAWEKHRAPSPLSHDHSLSSVVAESRSSRVRSGDGAEVDFRVSRYTWEKKNRAAPSSADQSLSSSVAGGSGASTINQSLEKHCSAAPSADQSLSSMASGSGESKVLSSSHTLEKYIAPSSSDQSLSSMAPGSGESKVISSSHTLEKYITPSSSDQSLSSMASGSGESKVLSSSHTLEKYIAPSSADQSLSSMAPGSGESKVISSSHTLEKYIAPSSADQSLSSMASGSGESKVISSSHTLEKYIAPSSADQSLSSMASGSGESKVLGSSHTLEKYITPSSSDQSLSSMASGSGESKVLSSSHTLEKYIAPSSSDSLSSMAPGSGESKFLSSSHTLEKYIAPSSADQSLSSMAPGSGESKVLSSSHTLEKYIAPSSSDQSLSSPVAAGTSKVSSGGDVDMEEESTWVDTNLFLYIQRFSKDQFDQCFRNHGVSAVFGDNDVADLTLISLRGGRDSKGLSEVQLTISELTYLVAVWQSTLRIHTIDYRRQDLRERQRLLQICAEVNTLYEDVLYVQKELGVRVIGPSISSHLFTEWVKDRMDQPHKEDFL